MDFLIKAPKTLTLYGAALALAALIIAVMMAGSFATGPAQAQNAANTYPDPQPCGPGAGTAFQPEPHEITTGDYALFDAYWEWRGQNPNEGVLHTNLCPPKVTTTTSFGVVTTARSVSNIDVDEAIFHVLSRDKTTVVQTNAEATDGQLSLEEYPSVAEGASAGDEVWWLRLDDPDTTKDDASKLSLGFSTALLDDDQYWFDNDNAGAPPLRYKFEIERYPGSDPMDVPHFFAYDPPKTGNATQVEAVWNSTRVDLDDDDVLMNPGEFRALQWVFTKPGTYLLSVHIQGFVRNALNPPPGAGSDWKPISDNKTETSEIKQYTIQVGDKLVEMEPPLFGVNPSVKENSPAGTRIGDPIPVYESEAETLEYHLSGTGSDAFTLIPTTSKPHAVQIAVADGAYLDYETKESYSLILEVTDNVDHENNEDATVDDTLAVNIDIEDIPVGVTLHASNTSPHPGETVTFTTELHDLGPYNTELIDYTFNDSRGGHSLGKSTHQIWHAGEATENVSVSVLYVNKGDDPNTLENVHYVNGYITVTWSNNNP